MASGPVGDRIGPDVALWIMEPLTHHTPSLERPVGRLSRPAPCDGPPVSARETDHESHWASHPIDGTAVISAPVVQSGPAGRVKGA